MDNLPSQTPANLFPFLFGILFVQRRHLQKTSFQLFSFWLCFETYRILVSQPGIKSASPALDCGFLTTGPLGKAQHFILKLLPWFPYPQPAPSSQKLKETAAHSSILAWEIPLDRGAWQATVHGVAKSCTRLSDGAHVRTLQPRTSAEFFD